MYCYAQPANLRTSTVFVLINYNRELKINLDKFVGKSYMITKDKDVAGKEIDTATHIR